MRTFTYLLLAGLLSPLLLHAQSAVPGGVPDAVLWGQTINTVTGPVFRVQTPEGVSVLAPEPAPAAANATGFNYHPALSFDGAPVALRLPLATHDLSKLTVFTVYWPTDSLTEKSIWYLEKNSKNRLMLTTHRVADLESVEFMNFQNSRKDIPQLVVYDRFRASDTEPEVGQTLVLGAKPVLPDVPVEPFRGKLAEIIVYDRVLAPEERGRVETYLAIKYGLALEPARTALYRNATDKVVRDGRKCEPYLHRVLGIGRDDASGLYQKQSSSSYDPDLLAVAAGALAASNAANASDLPDNTFLLWADNNAPLRLAPKTPGKPRLLNRQWRMTALGATQDIPTALRLNTRQTDWDWRSDEIWWLTIDRSATGQFPKGQVDYYPVASFDQQGIAFFSDILWDTDGNGSDVLAFSAGPAMFAKFWTTPPHCHPAADGLLHLGAEGGRPPYSFSVQGLDVNFDAQRTAPDNQLILLEGIQPGHYALTVRDATGRVSLDTVYVQSADASVSGLATRYTLGPGQVLCLDAAQGLADAEHLFFSWSGPDGFQSNSANVTIAQPGWYQLAIERDGCTARQDIEVVRPHTDPFRHTELFPNPAPEGRFTLLLDLYQPGPVDVRITDAAGRLVAERALQGNDRYFQSFQLDVSPGTYRVAAHTPDGVRTLSVVVPDSGQK